MNEEHNEVEQPAGECGPGCCCGTSGGGSRKKWVICGVVALAALVVVAAHVSRTRAASGQAKSEYAVPALAAVEAATPAAADAWGAPLTALAELNTLASNTEAVFVVLPSSDAERTAAIQKEVSAAAATIAARGSRMGTFVLSKEAKEYPAIARQVGTPAVLAMSKGLGMAAVKDKDVTQDNLLKAFVGSSRPSACIPSGCGPASAGCGPGASGCQ
jgi:hypothetical protein